MENTVAPKGPAPKSCRLCRKGKKKCGRERPRCNNCVKSGNEACIYEEARKPLAKPEDVVALKERLEYMESLLSAQSLLLTPVITHLQQTRLFSPAPYGISALTNPTPLNYPTSSSSASQVNPPPPELTNSQQPPSKRRRQDSEPFLGSSPGISLRQVSNGLMRPKNSRKATPPPDSDWSRARAYDEIVGIEVMDILIEGYFSQIHPSLPIIHRPVFSFRLEALRKDTLAASSSLEEEALLIKKRERNAAKVLPILDAIVVIMTPLPSTLSPASLPPASLVQAARSRVLLAAFNKSSFENLQALLVLATESIGQGKVLRGWTLIGSAVRVGVQGGVNLESYTSGKMTVTNTANGFYSGLGPSPSSFDMGSISAPSPAHASVSDAAPAGGGVASEDRMQQLVHPMSLLPLPEDWVDAETRRRVFFYIFILDRISSAGTGQPVALNARDILCKLPVDDFSWESSTEKPSSYASSASPFKSHLTRPRNAEGVKGSTSRNSASIESPSFNFLFNFSNFPSPVASTPVLPMAAPSPLQPNADFEEISIFGALIEATECLGQAQGFLLQPKEGKDAGSRFKELRDLDERLENWYMKLPEAMRKTRGDESSGGSPLDPNILFLHAIYNAAIIILNQSSAWPAASSLSSTANINPSSQLSSVCMERALSAVFAMTALLRDNSASIINTHLLLCFFVFISGRALLAHAKSIRGTETMEAELLVHTSALRTIQQRWALARFFADALELGMKEQQARLTRYITHLQSASTSAGPPPMTRPSSPQRMFDLRVPAFSKNVSEFHDNQKEGTAENDYSAMQMTGSNIGRHSRRFGAGPPNSHGVVNIPLPGRKSRSNSFSSIGPQWGNVANFSAGMLTSPFTPNNNNLHAYSPFNSSSINGDALHQQDLSTMNSNEQQNQPTASTSFSFPNFGEDHGANQPVDSTLFGMGLDPMIYDGYDPGLLMPGFLDSALDLDVSSWNMIEELIKQS